MQLGLFPSGKVPGLSNGFQDDASMPARANNDEIKIATLVIYKYYKYTRQYYLLIAGMASPSNKNAVHMSCDVTAVFSLSKS